MTSSLKDWLNVAVALYLRDLHSINMSASKSQGKLSGLKDSFSLRLLILWSMRLVKNYGFSVQLHSSCWQVLISFNIWDYCNFTFMSCIKGCWRQWRRYHCLWGTTCSISEQDSLFGNDFWPLTANKLWYYSRNSVSFLVRKVWTFRNKLGHTCRSAVLGLRYTPQRWWCDCLASSLSLLSSTAGDQDLAHRARQPHIRLGGSNGMLLGARLGLRVLSFWPLPWQPIWGQQGCLRWFPQLLWKRYNQLLFPEREAQGFSKGLGEQPRNKENREKCFFLNLVSIWQRQGSVPVWRTADV